MILTKCLFSKWLLLSVATETERALLICFKALTVMRSEVAEDRSREGTV